jgi:uncharacterized membrane protein YhaH (DUF805 family)
MLMFQPLKDYAKFTGRSRRAEYWQYILFIVVVSVALSLVDAVIGTGVLSAVFSLGAFIPSIAVGVRRLHDTGRSGWWMLILFIPLVGAIWLLVLVCLDSKPGDNAYGPNPKGM